MPLPRTVARMNRYIANPVLGRLAPVLPMFGIVRHIGRKSGKQYRVPVNIFTDGDDVVIALTYTSNSDWVKNVLAAGGCELESRGKVTRLVDPVLEVDHKKPWAPWVVRTVLGRLGVNEVLRLRTA